jgi:putative ABC transport system permease protein
LSTILQDLRFAIRGFARTPGVTLLAILTLAIGVGANAAIFSVVHSVMIDPLPYPAADRVVIPWRTSAAMGNLSISASPVDLDTWAKTGVFEAMTTYSSSSMVLGGGDEPEQLRAARVDGRFLDFTGAHPVLGRPFSPGDEASAESARVVLLTDGLWRSRFGGDRTVVGRQIELSDQRYEVIGVLPPAFRMPLNAVDLLLPLPPQPAGATGSSRSVPRSAVARLVPGITVALAEERLTAAGVQPIGGARDWRARLMRPVESTGPSFRRALLVLFGAVGFVLLIACANVANLVLARNASREREIALRAALGAGRWRLVRQLLTENLVLAGTGGVLGVLFGVWSLQGIVSLRPPDMRALEGLRLSWEMLAFGFGVAALTGVVFGVYPALAAARRDAADALRQGGRAAGDGRGRHLRRALSVAEVALALMLLAGAGILMRSYTRMQSADLGYEPDRLIALHVNLPASRYPSGAARTDFLQRLAENVRALPGVRYAGLASGLPPDGGLIFGQLNIEGQTVASNPGGFSGGWVSPGYFEAMGIPVRDGRGFIADDERKGANAVIINDAMAARFWPGESAVGKRMRLNEKGPWDTVVGVVGSIKSAHAEYDALQLYYPITGDSLPDMGLLVETTGASTALLGTIKGQVWNLDPKLPLQDVATLEARVAKTLARPRFNLVLLTIFAGIGLLLAAIGIYGVVSYSVGRRTREIGVRMALGALPRDVRRVVLGEALVIAGVGTVLGVAGALALGRFMQSMVYEVSPHDPATLAVVAVMLCGAALLAAWVPARRAMRVDPMVALRAE